jgi:PAS domain S-box-containing protein
VGGVAVTVDITERKRAEEALKIQAELLRLSYDAMIVWKLDGAIEGWNVGAERLYGYSEREVLGKVTHDLLRTVFPEPWDRIRSTIETRGLWEGELRHHVRDGREVVVSTRLQLIRGSDGIDRVLEINRDITAYRQSEERLRHAQKLESLGLLAGGVAHDFNNLLVGVIGNASLAQEMLPPDHPATELMETVVKTGEQAAHLTRQMLAYSGKGEFVVEPLHISGLVREIIDMVRPSIPKKVALNLDLNEDLPSIEVDRGQVQQILMNLAINAAEAIGSGDGLITVRTATEVVDDDYLRRHPEAADLQPGQYVVMEVRDNGCGMDGAVKAKIFDPFFSTKFTGRGLGLAAVAGIVRGHKGAIAVTSAPGKGSTFAVLFPPAAQVADRRPEARPSAVLEGSGVILVIDDEQVVRDMAKKGLERHGYTVLAAAGGMEAINILKRHPGNIDLAVLDLSMPGMSGEETLPELKKIRPQVKVVVSSGYSEAEAMRMFSGQRVSGFLQKPYTSAVLAEKVKRVLV